MEKITIRTVNRVELIDITDKIQNIVAKSTTRNGACVIFCPHTTAGFTINENADPSVRRDIITALNKLVPADDGYTHAEGNSDSHIKSSLLGPSLTVIIENGKLMLGTWQGIYFCEADGPRTREIWIKVLNDASEKRNKSS